MALPTFIPKGLFKNRLRPFFLVAVMVLIITEIVALSPSSLEQQNPPNSAISEEALRPDTDEKTLATGIPKGKVPEYSVDQFKYVSTAAGIKQWKIDAQKAYLYNHEKLVHARQVTAHLLDAAGKATIVTGKEAKYFMNQKDLEIYGSVVTKFPDGFETHSEYMRYQPDKRVITVPTSYPVEGDGKQGEGQRIRFNSHGLDFAMASSQIVLPEAVRLTMYRETSVKGTKPDETVIESDHCTIDRENQLAHFTMNPKRALDNRFVVITQPTMLAKSRRADLNYGNFSSVLQYLTAFEDVLIKERGKGQSLRYATGGRADFDNHRDVIVLTEFPQVYQDDDTVTGDIITMHRDTDIVEVAHSNAFSSGEDSKN
jgi:LPS export ABC transporter protein LptC